MLLEDWDIPEDDRVEKCYFIMEEEQKVHPPPKGQSLADRFVKVVNFHCKMELPPVNLTQDTSQHLFDLSMEEEEINLLQTQYEKSYS